MGDIINLRTVRKARKREAAAAQAAQNRAKHGVTKNDLRAIKDDLGRVERNLDGARLDSQGEE